MIMSTSRLANERARRREARLRQREQERSQRESLVFLRIPRLGEIKELQTEIGLDLARLVLRAPTKHGKSFDELREWSQALSAERQTLLHQHGMSPAELEIHYDCADCKDTGWLEPEYVESDRVRPSRKCHCLVQEEIEDLYRAAGLSGILKEQVFDRFDLTVYPVQDREYMGKVCQFCQAYAHKLLTGQAVDNLLLLGDVGRGKTFLASAIANSLVAAGRPVVYFTFSEFLDLVRLNKFEENEEYRQGVQRLLDADLIVLDDLGAEKVTEFVGQELFNVINQRINRKLPIVISTNLTPLEIDNVYGERLASRMLNGFHTLPLRGDDVRKVLRRRRPEHNA